MKVRLAASGHAAAAAATATRLWRRRPCGGGHVAAGLEAVAVAGRAEIGRELARRPGGGGGHGHVAAAIADMQRRWRPSGGGNGGRRPRGGGMGQTAVAGNIGGNAGEWAGGVIEGDLRGGGRRHGADGGEGGEGDRGGSGDGGGANTRCANKAADMLHCPCQRLNPFARFSSARKSEWWRRNDLLRRVCSGITSKMWSFCSTSWVAT